MAPRRSYGGSALNHVGGRAKTMQYINMGAVTEPFPLEKAVSSSEGGEECDMSSFSRKAAKMTRFKTAGSMSGRKTTKMISDSSSRPYIDAFRVRSQHGSVWTDHTINWIFLDARNTLLGRWLTSASAGENTHRCKSHAPVLE